MVDYDLVEEAAFKNGNTVQLHIEVGKFLPKKHKIVCYNHEGVFFEREYYLNDPYVINVSLEDFKIIVQPLTMDDEVFKKVIPLITLVPSNDWGLNNVYPFSGEEEKHIFHSKLDTPKHTLAKSYYRTIKISHTYTNSLQADQVMKIVQDHANAYESALIENEKDFVKLMSPLSLIGGWDGYDVVHLIGSDLNFSKLLTDMEYRDCVAKIMCAGWGEDLSESVLEGVVKDIDTSKLGEVKTSLTAFEFKEAALRVTGIPIKNREYALGLKVKDFRNFITMEKMGLNTRTNVKQAIDYTEDNIADKMTDEELLQAAYDAHSAAFRFIIKVSLEKHTDLSLASDFYRRIIKLSNEPNTIKVAREFFENCYGNFATMREIFDASSFFLYPAQWLSGSKNCNYVLGKLHEQVGSGTGAMLRNFVVESDYSLTTPQWVKIAEEYDEFKDVPLSWWKSMV